MKWRPPERSQKRAENAAVRKVNELVKRVRLSKGTRTSSATSRRRCPDVRQGKRRPSCSTTRAFLKVHRAQCRWATSPTCPSSVPDGGARHPKFPKLDTRLIETMDTVLSRDLPKLLAMFPQEGSHTPTEGRMTQAIMHVGANLAVAPPQQQQIGHNAPPPPPPGPPGYPQPPRPMPPQTYQQPYPEAAARTLALDNPAPPPGPSPFDEPAGGLGWAVSAEDKARYDEIFASSIPPTGWSGYGWRPYQLLNLPVDILARCGTSPTSTATVASTSTSCRRVHLARESTNGKPTPQTLPPNLVRPSGKGGVDAAILRPCRAHHAAWSVGQHGAAAVAAATSVVCD